MDNTDKTDQQIQYLFSQREGVTIHYYPEWRKLNIEDEKELKRILEKHSVKIARDDIITWIRGCMVSKKLKTWPNDFQAYNEWLNYWFKKIIIPCAYLLELNELFEKFRISNIYYNYFKWITYYLYSQNIKPDQHNSYIEWNKMVSFGDRFINRFNSTNYIDPENRKPDFFEVSQIIVTVIGVTKSGKKRKDNFELNKYENVFFNGFDRLSFNFVHFFKGLPELTSKKKIGRPKLIRKPEIENIKQNLAYNMVNVMGIPKDEAKNIFYDIGALAGLWDNLIKENYKKNPKIIYRKTNKYFKDL